MAGFLDRAKEQAQRGLTQGKQKLDDVQAQRAGGDLLEERAPRTTRSGAARLRGGDAAGSSGPGEPYRHPWGRLPPVLRLPWLLPPDQLRHLCEPVDPAALDGALGRRPHGVAAREGGPEEVHEGFPDADASASA